MAIGTGQVSMQDIATEFGGDAPHALSEYYNKGNAPASGEIQIHADFQGTAAVTAATSVPKLPAPLATSTIVPTVVASVVSSATASIVSSLSLPHADKVSAITTAIAANTPERLAFIHISFSWIALQGKF